MTFVISGTTISYKNDCTSTQEDGRWIASLRIIITSCILVSTVPFLNQHFIIRLCQSCFLPTISGCFWRLVVPIHQTPARTTCPGAPSEVI